jgi:hypothetical protein
MAKVTAKVALNGKEELEGGETKLSFYADYMDGRNKEWSKYTPALGVTMQVIPEVAALFEEGGKYTLTFEESDDNGGNSAA